ncbi:MAG TPA: hypothetical protein PLA94_24640, partial [Myxococcota bacterium]|nr:hypothetical protein [Myxococcota bacterium]
MLLMLLGCTSSDYSLNLTPVVPLNQSQLFAELDSVQVDFVKKSGDIGDPTDLGAPLTGEKLSAEGPLFEQSYARIRGVKEGEAIAWGRTELLPAQKRIQRNVLVGSSNGIGWLAAEPVGTVGGELTPLGGGRFLLSGGMYIDEANRKKPVTTDIIREIRLEDADAALSFADFGTLPPYPDPTCVDCGTLTARIGHHLTPMGGSDAGKLLLTGGTARYGSMLGDNSYYFPDDLPYTTDDAQIYDVESGTWEPVIHDSTQRRIQRQGYRTRHLAAQMPDGGVALFGGFADRDSWENPLVEVLVAGQREMKTIELPEEFDIPGSFGAAAASTPEGVVICGGSSDLFDAELSSSSACVIVRSASTVESFPSLGAPRSGLAMIGLPDGRIIATGGAEMPENPSNIVTAFFEGHLASADLLIYENGVWEKLPGALKTPRANHSMALLPDGKVLIYGGTSHYGHMGFPIDTEETVTLECAQLFDPYTRALTSLEGCPDNVWGPAIAADPEYGIVAAGGLVDVAQPTPGVAFFPGELP